MQREKTIRNEFATKAQVRFEVERYCHAWLPVASDVDQICSKTTSPEECANELRKKWKLGNSAIRNLTGIIEDRGIHVITLEQQKGFDGVCGEQITPSESKRFWMMMLRRQGVAKTDGRRVERSDWLVRTVSRLYSEEIIDATKVDKWLDPETAAEIKDGSNPSTAWEFRNLTPDQRAKLLQGAVEAAAEYYNSAEADIVAEETELYDDSTKA